MDFAELALAIAIYFQGLLGVTGFLPLDSPLAPPPPPPTLRASACGPSYVMPGQ